MIDPRRRLFLRGRLSEAAAPRPIGPQRPPWALDEARFAQRCTRCHACVSECPRQVLAVGDGGFPHMHFQHQGCDLCGACASACQPRALDRAAAESHCASTHASAGAHAPAAAHAAWPGWTMAVGPQCLTLHKVECRACGDACDRGAIRFRPAPGGIAQMQLTPADCIACGDCVGVCPAGAVHILHTSAAQDPGTHPG